MRRFDEINAAEGSFLIGWLEPPVFCRDPGGQGSSCKLDESATWLESLVIVLVIAIGLALVWWRLSAFVALTWAGRDASATKKTAVPDAAVSPRDDDQAWARLVEGA